MPNQFPNARIDFYKSCVSPIHSPPATPFHQNISPANGLNPRPRRTIVLLPRLRDQGGWTALLPTPTMPLALQTAHPTRLVLLYTPRHTPIIRYNCRLLNVFRLATYNETSFSFWATIYLRPSSHNPLLLYPFIIH